MAHIPSSGAGGSDPYHGLEHSTKLCAQFVSHLFTCPNVPPPPPPTPPSTTQTPWLDHSSMTSHCDPSSPTSQGPLCCPTLPWCLPFSPHRLSLHAGWLDLTLAPPFRHAAPALLPLGLHALGPFPHCRGSSPLPIYSSIHACFQDYL
jgi:hypothetical protein